MYRIHDDGVIDIIRGDSADFDVSLYYFDSVSTPIPEMLSEYYELYDGMYRKTYDTRIVPGKNYYILDEYELKEGETVTFTLKKSAHTDNVIFSKTGPHIVIRPEDTESLKYGRYKYDVEFSNQTRTIVDTVIESTDFNIKTEVTF